jgi:hypothetical protein
MKKLVFRLCILVLLYLPCLCLASEDWQSRCSVSLQNSLSEKFTFIANTEFRFIDNSSQTHYVHLETGIEWKLNTLVNISVCYRHISNKSNSNWETEFRPHLNTTIKWNLFDFSFKNRMRLEYRIRNHSDSFRYTNKLSVQFHEIPWEGIRPCLGIEPFYDFDKSSWNKIRYSAGFDWPISKQVQGHLEYLRESSKSDTHWTYANNVCVSFRFSI